MLKVCEGLSESSVLSVDSKRRQVTLYEPSPAASCSPPDRRLAIAAPKMFAFDAVFSHEDPQAEVCGTALTDLIHAVITGTDGCLFCYGHPKLGKYIITTFLLWNWGTL
ncbi:hypothetical protein AAG570_003830 [Ranatra chinensis]|uniref:Kinesin motor domain-containing protein n=1 Tax=Ranatra chinensis TaxID=642074 RepID=A0ABD0Y217_9HEMI